MALIRLAPEVPLTQDQVDALNLADALHSCAGCGVDLEEGEGRLVGFKVADRSRIAFLEGRVLHLPIDEEQVVPCIVAVEHSDSADACDDLVVQVCSSGCEKAIRKVVPFSLDLTFDPLWPLVRAWRRRRAPARRREDAASRRT